MSTMDELMEQDDAKAVPLTMDNVTDVCDILTKAGFTPSSWKSLAARLRISDPESINIAYQDPALCLSEVIRRWICQEATCTWEKLATVVSKVSGYGEGTKQAILSLAMRTKDVPETLDESDLSIMVDLLMKAAVHWRWIGLYLGFESAELSIIQQNPALLREGNPGFFRQMLTNWLKWAPPRHPYPTIEAMADVLRVVKEENMADNLRNSFLQAKAAKATMVHTKKPSDAADQDTQPTVPLTMDNVTDVCDILMTARFTPSSWESLAARLGISDPGSIAHRDPTRCLSEVIRRWIHQEATCTWEKLATEVSKVYGYGEGTKQAILSLAMRTAKGSAVHVLRDTANQDTHLSESQLSKPKEISLELLLRDTPPEALDRVCSIEDLLTISLSITDWRSIAPYLGLTKDEEEEVDMMYYSSMKRQRLAMLRRWKQKFGSAATYRRLVEAFYKCGRYDLMGIVQGMQTKLVLDPSNAVEVCDVLRESGISSSDWENLAARLCKDIDVESIRESMSNPQRCLHETIRQWLYKDPEPSWEKLTNVVAKIDHYGPYVSQQILRNASAL